MSKKLKVLLVEDCAKDAELATNNLRVFELTVVHTLPDGLAALDKGAFDCVLLDLNLKNGRKPADILIQVDKHRGKAATVIVTGDCNPAMRLAMLTIGADGFMQKGSDDKTPEDVAYIIYRAFERREKQLKGQL